MKTFHLLFDDRTAAQCEGFFGSGSIIGIRTGRHDRPIQIVIEDQLTSLLSIASQDREDGSITYEGRTWRPTVAATQPFDGRPQDSSILRTGA